MCPFLDLFDVSSPWLPSPHLQEEKLDGENRYFCESCQSKQNATRRIKLNSLPPTLNLQLMRFVFDRSVIRAESTAQVHDDDDDDGGLIV